MAGYTKITSSNRKTYLMHAACWQLNSTLATITLKEIIIIMGKETVKKLSAMKTC